MKVLMVCLGNICRSPLAEGILKDKAKKNNLNWEVDSAGISSYHAGDAPDPRSVEVAAKHGIDISTQRSRQFVMNDFEKFDKIYVMDDSNYDEIMLLADTDPQREKVELILKNVPECKDYCVPDPYWDDNGFENVFKMLDEACDKIIEDYKAKVGQEA